MERENHSDVAWEENPKMVRQTNICCMSSPRQDSGFVLQICRAHAEMLATL